MVSKKSERFKEWVEKTCGDNMKEVPRLLVDLELAARLVTHDVDLMGEPGAYNLHRLVRASKLLREAYEQD